MSRVPQPGDPAAAIARLVAQVDQLTHDIAAITALRADVETHTRTLADLADVVRRINSGSTPDRAATSAAGQVATAIGGTDDREPGDPAPDWLTVTDPALAIAWLNSLDHWIRNVWTRYQPLPVCWPWHPAVVAELLVCAHTWATATLPDLGPEPLAVWHDRWRPGTSHRVTKAMTACERADGDHITGPGTRWAPDPTYLDELAHWWATTHGATPAPGLTKLAGR